MNHFLDQEVLGKVVCVPALKSCAFFRVCPRQMAVARQKGQAMKKNEKVSNNVRENEKEQEKVLRPVPLRVNPETIEANKSMKSKIVYVKIGSRKYPCIIEWVTEEVYRAYMRMEWADIKAMERAERCLIPDGKGGFIMCPECNKCCGCKKAGHWDFDNNHPVHIEALCNDENDDKGFDVKADSVNDARDIMANEIADQIEAELRKIKPKYAIIFREMFNGNLQAINIAKNNNLSVSTTYEDIPKVMKAAQKIFALLMK